MTSPALSLPASRVRLTLPEPPSTNRYWRVYQGHAVKAVEAHEYIEAVSIEVRKQIPASMRATLPLTGAVAIALAWYRSARCGDLDNRSKVILDALEGLVYQDDSQIVGIILTRHESPRRGRLEVDAWSIAPAEEQLTLEVMHEQGLRLL